VKLAIVICFRDEERYLPRLFSSLARQTDPADMVVLVDDGSVDSSTELAREFADRSENTKFLIRSRTGAEAVAHAAARDRLAAAPELQGFRWGVQQLKPGWEIVAKLDGDLELPATLFAEVRRALGDDPKLGIVGSYLSVGVDGGLVRERHPSYHVRGPNKFYRRECLLEIDPLPAHLGWDMIDELRARRFGWRTSSISPSSGDVVHLRPTGTHDGRIRAYWRWGRCAWGYGAHPLAVAAGALKRSTRPPYGVGGASYVGGWAAAGIQRAPRAELPTRAFSHQEDLKRIRGAIIDCMLRFVRYRR
jgi:poly-beta-1,6-N-acetyl-D-glucosamine synthase